MAVPIGGMIASAGYCYLQNIRRQQEEEDERWNSLSEEEKRKIIEADLEIYRFNKECERKKYLKEYKEKLLRLERRKARIAKVKEFIDDYFLIYLYLLSNKFFNLKTNYFICIPNDFYKYLHIYSPIKFIDLNDYQTVARILVSTHNVNFNKLKMIIKIKYRDFDSRIEYLKLVDEHCKMFTDENWYILKKIFKENLGKKLY